MSDATTASKTLLVGFSLLQVQTQEGFCGAPDHIHVRIVLYVPLTMHGFGIVRVAMYTEWMVVEE